jgi:hypothetical protein
MYQIFQPENEKGITQHMYILKKIKSVAHSFQGSYTRELDFYN